jgi:hypothetical protein
MSDSSVCNVCLNDYLRLEFRSLSRRLNRFGPGLFNHLIFLILEKFSLTSTKFGPEFKLIMDANLLTIFNSCVSSILSLNYV